MNRSALFARQRLPAGCTAPPGGPLQPGRPASEAGRCRPVLDVLRQGSERGSARHALHRALRGAGVHGARRSLQGHRHPVPHPQNQVSRRRSSSLGQRASANSPRAWECPAVWTVMTELQPHGRFKRMLVLVHGTARSIMCKFSAFFCVIFCVLGSCFRRLAVSFVSDFFFP